MENKELLLKLKDSKQNLLDLKLKQSFGQSQKSHLIREKRKSIARILTAINASL